MTSFVLAPTPALAASPGCLAVNAGGLDQNGRPLLANRVIQGTFYPGEVLTMTFSSSVALPLSVVTLSTTGPLSLSTSINLPLLGTGPYSANLTITGNGALGAEAGILAVGTLLGTVNLTVRCQGVTAPTTTLVATSANPTAFGQATTFRATVATPAGSAQVPTGNVTFNVGGTTIGPVAVDASGVATATTSTLAPGTYSVTANYAGATGFAASTGTLSPAQTVSQASTATSVSASANPTYGSPVTFTATTSSVAPGGGTPTGNVIFNIGGTDQAPVALTNGSASITRSNLPTGNTAISARYVASTNYAASTGTLAGGVSVGAAATTTTLSQSSTTSPFGDAVTFRAQVASGGGQPTGSVIFIVDDVARSPVTLSNGVAEISIPNLAVGNHTISAAFQASTNFAASSGTLTGGHVVTRRSTTLSMSGPGSIEFGQSATIVANVAGAGGPPTGTVTFTVDNQARAPIALNNGSASITLSGLTVGSHTISATYSGAPTYDTSNATLTGGQTVTAATTSLGLAASPSTGTFGSAATFTASVTSASGVPGGNVIFTIDNVAQAPVALSGGTASITTSSLGVGSHNVSARYEGSTTFLASSSSLAASYSVSRATPSFAVSSSTNPAVIGQSVDLIASISATFGTPTGTVIFTVDGNALPAATLANGTARVTLPALAIGNHPVSVRYSGDTNFVERTGSLAGGQDINRGNVSLSVTANPASSAYGQPVTVRADVAATAPASGTPSGQVVFLVDGVAQPAVTLTNGRAEVTLNNLGPGNHTISAAYQGGTDFNPGTATLANGINISKASTTNLLSLDAPSIAFGQTGRATVTITATSGTPDGEVVFTVNGQARAPVALRNGTAHLDLANLAAGDYAISAAYAGSANFAASSSATARLTITPAQPALGLSASAQTIAFGDSVTLNAILTTPAGVPVGSVEFLANGATIGTATLTDGRASLSTASLPFGAAEITARYNGSANFASMTAALGSTISVTGRVPEITVSVAPSSVDYGETPLASIAVRSPAGVPQGSVVLTIGEQTFEANLASGSASIPLTGLPPGTHAVSVRYTGTTPFLAASATGPSVTIGRAETNLSLSAISSTLVFGQALELQANVTSSFGNAAGGVIFTIDGTDYPRLIAKGSASLSLPGLLPGSHSVSVRYPGSATHEPATASLAAVSVAAASTSLSITAPSPTITFGNSLVLDIAAQSPVAGLAGRVIVSVDGNDRGATNLVDSAARITIDNLPVGNHDITARLEPVAGFATISAELENGITVTAAPVAISIVPAPDEIIVGAEAVFDVRVSSAAGNPTGEIIPIVDGISLSPVTLVDGRATFSTTFATSGDHAISVRYGGSESFAANIGNLAGGISVTGAAAEVTLAVEPEAPVFGQPLTLSAAVSSQIGVPTGLVAFTSGGVSLGSAPLVDGVATLTLNQTPPGTIAISAVYGGDAAHLETRASIDVAIRDAETTLSLTSSATTIYAGAPVTLIARLDVLGLPVSGSVIFSVGDSDYTAPIVDGSATITLNDLPEGSFEIGARFEGAPGLATSIASLPTPLVVEPAPTDIIVDALVPRSVAGEALSFEVIATGGVAPYSYAVTGGTLPKGVTLDARTGVIAGTPDAAGDYNFTLTVSGVAGMAGSLTLDLTVLEPANLVLPKALAESVFGTAFSADLSATGGTGPYSYSLEGNLPDGVEFDPESATLNGTALALGQYDLRLTATDANGFTASQTLRLTIVPPTLEVSADMPEGGAFVPYEGLVSVTGGIGPYTFAIDDGALPEGLALDATTGIVSGTPRIVGAANFTLMATDSNGFSGRLPITLSIAQVFVVTLPDLLADGRQFRPFGQVLAAQGGTAPYAYAITDGTLPDGLVLDPATGAIAGTPSVFGDFAFTLTAVDANDVAGSASYNFSIAEAATLVAETNLAAATAGSEYTTTLSVTGGIAPYSFALVSSDLPDGIEFDPATGTIGGTPNQAGTFSLIVEIIDANGDRITQAFVIEVLPPNIVISANFPPVVAGQAYDGFLTITGGSAPFVFTFDGTMPRGLTFDPETGAIAGLATQVGTFPLTIVVRDANGFEARTEIALDVAAETTMSLVADRSSIAFGESIELTANVAAAAEDLSGRVVFSVDGRDVGEAVLVGDVARLQLDGLTVGPHAITARFVPDEGFSAASAELAEVIEVVAAGVELSVTGPVTGSVVGETTQFSVSLVSPAGVPTGTIIPIVDGIEQAPVELTNGTAQFDYTFDRSGNHSVSVLYLGSESFAAANADLAGGIDVAGADAGLAVAANPASPTFGQATTVTATLNSNFGTPRGVVTFARDGVALGTVPLVDGAASLIVADLPPGTSTISISYSGDLAHVATSQVLDIAVTDAETSIELGTSATEIYAGAPVTLSASIDSGAGPVHGELVFVVGDTEYPVTISDGRATLTLTDLTEGEYAVSVRFTGIPGLAPSVANLDGSIIVGPAPTDIEIYADIPRSVAGEVLTIAPSATGGIGPYAFAITDGELPAGLVLDPSTGAISGTPTMPGMYEFVITVSGTAGAPGSISVNLVVLEAAALVLPDGIDAATFGVAISADLTASGGTAPYQYVLSGTLPQGVAFDPATGLLSGTPRALGNYEFSLSVTDANGFSLTRSFSLVIDAPAVNVAADLPQAGAFVPYQAAVAVSGGAAPYRFAVTAGALPPGLALEPDSGSLSGVPRLIGDYSFTITATDADGFTGDVSISLAVEQVFTIILPETIAPGRQFQPFGQSLAASGGIAPYQYEITAGMLPDGLALNGANGTISGTPTGAGDTTFTLTATDTNGVAGSAVYTLSVTEAAILIVDTALAPAVAGIPYSQSISVTGGADPYRFALISGALPSGLSFDPTTGTFAGTATEDGSFSVVIEISDENGDRVTQGLTINVGAPEIVVSADFPTASAGEPFSGTTTVIGGAAPYQFELDGALPQGLSFDAMTGAISGTPGEVGLFPVTITIRDANGYEQSASAIIDVTATTEMTVTADPQSAVFGDTIRVVASVEGPLASINGVVIFSVDGNEYALVPVTDGAAALSLPRLTVGDHAISARFEGAAGFLSSAAEVSGGISIVAASSSLSLTARQGPNVVGEPITFAVSLASPAGTPDGSVIFTIDGNDLPAIALADGIASVDHVFETSGNHSVTVRYTGSENFEAETAVLAGGIDISGATTGMDLTLSGQTPVFGQSLTLTASVNADYGTASGIVIFTRNGVEVGRATLGDGVARITIENLPAGNSTIAARYQGDASHAPSDASIEIVIGDAATTMTLGAAPASVYEGAPVTITANITSNAGPVIGDVIFEIDGVEYPVAIAGRTASLTLSSLATGNYPVTARFEGSPGFAATDAVLDNAIVVSPQPTDIIVYADVPRSVAGETLAIEVSASGGIGPYAFVVSDGALPVGLLLDTDTGTISGTPEEAGSYAFTVTASGSAGAPGSLPITLDVLAPAIITMPEMPGEMVFGLPFNFALPASGGTAPYVYTLTGTLPAGVSFDPATATLSGTPTALGTFELTLSVTDANGFSASRTLALVVVAPEITVSANLPTAGAFVAYEGRITANGGTSPYTFAVTDGALPAGLTLDSGSGAITGTPRSVGEATFSISVTDANGFVTTRPFTIVVDQAFSIALPETLADARQFRSYGQVIVASGGTEPYSYAVTEGALPDGLVLDSETGRLSGTPSQDGSTTFSITATDANGVAGSRSYDFTIVEASTLVPGTDIPSAVAGEAYDHIIAVSGGAAPYSFGLVSGDLPAGMSFDAATGRLSGTPTEDGAFPLVIQISDANGDTMTQSFVLTVVAPNIEIDMDLPIAEAGKAFTGTISVSGGALPLHFSLDGSLPEGLIFDAETGAISGIPTGVGTYPINVTVTDANGYETSANAIIAVEAATTLTLSAADTSITFGDIVSVEAELTSTANAIEGWVVFTVDGQDYADLQVVDGAARLVIEGLTVGSHTIAARFEPAPGFLPADAVLEDGIDVTAATASISITPPSGDIVAGTSVSFAIAVDADAGVPGGSVVPVIDGRALPAIALTNGTASFSYAFASSGAHSVEIRYSGSENFAAGTMSLAGGVVVVGAQTSLALASTPAAPVFGQALTIMANVSSGLGTPSGIVVFSRNGEEIGSVPLSGGEASLDLSGVVAGEGTFVAFYLGDAAHEPSQADLILTVSDAETELKISASPSTLYEGQPVTLSATLSSAAGIPTGNIIFTIGGTDYPVALTNGSADITITDLPVGNQSVTARYDGAPGFAASASELATPIVVEPTPADIVLSVIVPRSVAGEALSIEPTTTGGIAPYSYAITSGALPSGMSLDQQTGIISGVPATPGLYSFTLTASGSAGTPGSIALDLNVLTPTDLIVPDALAAATFGEAVTIDLAATGGTEPYTYNVSGTLPPGVNFDPATAALSGTPTALGRFEFSLTVTDANGFSVERSYTLTVDAPALSVTLDLPDAGAFVPYSGIVSVNAGTAPYTFNISEGALPDGLSLDAQTGAITGTPRVVGEMTFTLTVRDTNGFAVSQGVTLNVERVFEIVLPENIATGRQFRPFAQQLIADGGTAPYTYAISGGSLPRGLSLDPTNGAIAGVPEVAGDFTFTLLVTDTNGVTGSATYNIEIAQAATLVPDTSLENPVAGTNYSATLSVTGGAAPYDFTFVSGTLPDGLAFDASTGTLSGVATQDGTFSFVVRIVDQNGDSITQTFRLTVRPPDITVSIAVPQAFVGEVFASSLTVTGGAQPVTFALSGTLPAGLSFDPVSGAITGIPEEAGSFAFAITVTDANGYQQSASGMIDIAEVPPPVRLDIEDVQTAAILGTLYNRPLTVSGGTAPYRFGIASGVLPSSLSLDEQTGVISGNVDSVGSFAVVIFAEDGAGNRGERSFVFVVAPPAFEPDLPSEIAEATGSAPYHASLAVDGQAPLTYGVTAGALPPGLTLDVTTGQISGTPISEGTFSFEITVTNGYDQTALASLQISVTAPLLSSATTLPNAIGGTAYEAVIEPTGGVGPYIIDLLSPLPDGLTYDTGTGIISGTPLVAGSFMVSLVITDANGFRSDISLPLTIAVPQIIVDGDLPPARVGAAFSFTPQVSGGAPDYEFSLLTGSLPQGLSLDPQSGTISGVPSLASTAGFTIAVSDANGFTTTRSFALTVATNAGTVQLPADLGDGQVGVAYIGSAAGAGGTIPLTYAISQGTLPAGVSLDSQTGALSGSPTEPGTALFTITVTDGEQRINSRHYVIRIEPAPLEMEATFPSAQLGQNYTDGIVVSGGVEPYGFALSNAPRDLTIDPQTGVISGIPRQSGTFDVVVVVTDAAGQSAQLPGTITVEQEIITLVLRDIATDATLGEDYASSVAASNGVGTVTYQLVAGALPDGVDLDETSGLLSGTPTSAGIAEFTVQATDSQNNVGTRGYSLAIAAGETANLASTIEIESGANTADLGDVVRFEVYVATTDGPVTAGAVSLLDAENGAVLDSTLLGNSGTAVLSFVADAAGERSFIIRFSGAPNIDPSESAPLALTVSAATTITSIEVVPENPAASEEVELVASVERENGDPVSGGEISFYLDETLFETVTVGNGIATASVVLPAGSHEITVRYEPAGGDELPSETSITLLIAGNATITLTGPQGQLDGDESPTYTANVRADVSGAPAPTGTISFQLNGSEIANVQLSGGTAAVTLDPLPPGNHAISAIYSGDDVYESVASSVINVVVLEPIVEPTGTTTTLSARTFSPVVGDPITLTANVAGSGSTIPSGTVRFIDQSTGMGIGTGTLNRDGVATLLHRFTDADTRTIAAEYQGDDFNISSGDQRAFDVMPSPTGIVLEATTEVVGLDETTTLTAQFGRTPEVRGPPRVDVIEFRADDQVFATVSVNGSTTVTVETPPIQSTTEFTASLVPEAIDRTDLPSTSNPVFVGLAAVRESTTTSLTVSPSTSSQGQSATLTAEVTSATGTPDGDVRFTQNGTVLGQATLSGNLATISVTTLPLGTSTITADYLGNASFEPSSDSETALVTPPPGIATLTISGTAVPDVVVSVGQSISLSFDIGALGGDVTDIALSIPGARDISCPSTSLLDGDAMTCTATYVTTLADLESKTINVSATVTGTGANPASTDLSIAARGNEVIETFDDLTSQFIASRARMITGISLPDIFDRRMAPGGNRAGTLTARTEGHNQNYQFATSLEQVRGFMASQPGAGPQEPLEPSPFNAWVDMRLAISGIPNDDEQWSRLAVAAAGVDFLVNDNLLVGIAGQMDWMTDETTDSEFSGTGYLVGPYASLALSENLSLDVAVFYGQSNNTGAASIGGITYSGDFETTRLLATAGLGGYFELEEFVLRPSATFFLSSEQADGYTVSDENGASVPIPSEDVLDVLVRGGLTIERAIDLENGATLTPMVGLNLSYGGAIDESGFDDRLTGGIMGGLLYDSGNFSAKGSVEAEFGTDGFEGVTGRISITGKF